MKRNFKLNLDGAEWRVRQALVKNEEFIKTIYKTSIDNIIQVAKSYGKWNCDGFSVKCNNEYGVDHFEIWE